VAAFLIRVEMEVTKRPRSITAVDAQKTRSYNSGGDCFDCRLDYILEALSVAGI